MAINDLSKPTPCCGSALLTLDSRMSIYEQAALSQRLRTRDVPEWCAFLRLWAAFNSLYSEETNPHERERAIQVVWRYISAPRALVLIEETVNAAREIIATPPGDMRKDASDPQFREQTNRCAAGYSDSTRPSNERIASLMGVIYQVRCNLLHGDKDPDDARDMVLIRSSNTVLESVLPALEDAIRERF